MQPLLTIQNLSVDFISESGTTNADKNISLTVNKGEIVAIVGESGSGKSVTSLSILQLQKLLKKLVYKKRKSAAQFYNEERGYGDYEISSRMR